MYKQYKYLIMFILNSCTLLLHRQLRHLCMYVISYSIKIVLLKYTL
jgi:hypothetical protein